MYVDLWTIHHVSMNWQNQFYHRLNIKQEFIYPLSSYVNRGSSRSFLFSRLLFMIFNYAYRFDLDTDTSTFLRSRRKKVQENRNVLLSLSSFFFLKYVIRKEKKEKDEWYGILNIESIKTVMRSTIFINIIS